MDSDLFNVYEAIVRWGALSPLCFALNWHILTFEVEYVSCMDKQKAPVWYKRRRNWVIAVVLVILFFVIRKATSGSSAPRETATVSRGTVKEELVLSGELKATANATMAFNQSGTVSWVGVKVGDSVKKGQALIKLDTTSTNAAYQQARSNLLAAEANVNYVHDNLKNKSDSETYSEKNTRVAAEVAHDNAYNTMLAAQKTLRDGSIYAPFAGIVAQLTNESAGVNVTAGAPQINIVNPTTLYFSVNADQTDVSHLHVGDTAVIALDSFLDEHITGVVSDISFTPSTADSGTVYPVRVTLSVDNSTYKYKVGMTGDTTFTLSQKENVLSVPAKFVKSDKEGKYVYIDSKNTKKYIKVGIEGDDKTEIQGDISEGTVVYD